MSSTHPSTRRLPSALALVVSIALLGPAMAAQGAAQPETPEQKLLRIVSTASAESMRAEYDLDDELVQKIMAHRKAGKTFSTAEEFKEVTGVTPAQVLYAMELDRKEKEKTLPPGSPTAEPRERQKAMPGAVVEAEPQEHAPVVSNIRPGFYGQLPGYEDLDSIEPLLKKEFLERINYEKCPCGCENETLAYCLVNDPGCPVVKARARKIYEEVIAKTPPASAEPKE